MPLNEYYSPKIWEKLVQRIKSAFRLEPLLRELAKEEEPDPDKAEQTAPAQSWKSLWS